MALNSLFCADVPLSNYSLTHYQMHSLNARKYTLHVILYGYTIECGHKSVD